MSRRTFLQSAIALLPLPFVFKSPVASDEVMMFDGDIKLFFVDQKLIRREYTDGTKKWYLDGKLHRTDGPATEFADGSKYWLQHGELHRDDGPAVEFVSGRKEWWANGKLHREGGPAIEHSNGGKTWYHEGYLIKHYYHDYQAA